MLIEESTELFDQEVHHPGGEKQREECTTAGSKCHPSEKRPLRAPSEDGAGRGKIRRNGQGSREEKDEEGNYTHDVKC